MSCCRRRPGVEGRNATVVQRPFPDAIWNARQWWGEGEILAPIGSSSRGPLLVERDGAVLRGSERVKPRQSRACIPRGRPCPRRCPPSEGRRPQDRRDWRPWANCLGVPAKSFSNAVGSLYEPIVSATVQAMARARSSLGVFTCPFLIRVIRGQSPRTMELTSQKGVLLNKLLN